MFAVAFHGQLLQIRGKALQVLLVGKDAEGLRAEEIAIPDGKQSHQHGQILFEWRGAEMFVNLVEAAEHGAEIIRARWRASWKGRSRNPSNSGRRPNPRISNMLAVSIPNLVTSAALVETATKCLAMDFSSPPSPLSVQSRAVCALVIVSSVVKVFEETIQRVSDGSMSRTASAKSVPSTLETKRNVMCAVAVAFERFVSHHRTEVGAADANINDVADAFAGVAFPFPAAHAVAEGGHFVEHGVNARHYVFAIHNDGCSLSERAEPRAARRAFR